MKTNSPKIWFSKLYAFSFMLYALFPIALITLLAASPVTTRDAEPAATNLIYQSKDGGRTWQDISPGLPVTEQPEDFFAGESDLYLRVKSGMYRSKSNLKTPVWEKVNALETENASIAFNRSGVMAYNYAGQILQQISTETWLPRYANLKKHSMRTIVETTDGTLFVAFDSGLYKSVDSGKTWRQVQNQGWVMNIAESEGVLVATSQKGIMRSTDNGENWELMISEGGVGIAIERIDGGFAAIAYNTTIQSRRIHISLDKGKTWTAVSDGLRPSSSISSIKQIGGYLLCGHPDGIFRSSDMGKTWTSVHPGVDLVVKISLNNPDNGRVFKLHVSGSTVYAVSASAGC
jgi:photosystem II stability/assembly factor-like uncharacterized protein